MTRKFQKWYDQQNDATKSYLDARMADDTKFALQISLPAIGLGAIIGFLVGLSI